MENFAVAARAAIRPTAVLPAPGPLPGPIALPPTRRFQNHAGLRGRAGNPSSMPSSVKNEFLFHNYMFLNKYQQVVTEEEKAEKNKAR